MMTAEQLPLFEQAHTDEDLVARPHALDIDTIVAAVSVSRNHSDPHITLSRELTRSKQAKAWMDRG